MFGSLPGPSGAQFEKGQQWLPGSAPEFVRFLSQKFLGERFPLLRDAAYRHPPHWANEEGVVHLVRRKSDREGVGAWFLAHCFQPDYSTLRSVPMWIAINGTIDEVRPMRLPSLLSSLEDGRRLIDARPLEFGQWLEAAEPGQGAEPSIADVRMAAALHDELFERKQAVAPAFSDTAYWRAMQLVLEGLVSERSEESLSVSIRIEPSGVLPHGHAYLAIELDPAKSIVPAPFRSRGVEDSAIVERLGAREVIGSVMRARTAGRQGSFAQLVEVPLDLLDCEAVEDERRAAWCETQWRLGRAEAEMKRLAASIRRGEHRPHACAMLARLLVAEPSAQGPARAKRLEWLAGL
ncbi:MAG: hypothetical protein ACKOYN_08570 [Planctomycetota bacterium]